MTLKNYIAAEFPGELQDIQRLRSADAMFDEICNDLELLNGDLSLFSEEERLRSQAAYLDICESIQALHQELIAFLHRNRNSVVRDL